jgi:hypothetical protein
VHGLARLEVDRPVLHLHHHVGGELAVERLEVRVRLLGAILGVELRMEGAPHHDPAMGRDARASMFAPSAVALVVVGARLPRIRLCHEAAEVRDSAVDSAALRIHHSPTADWDQR